MSHGPRGPAIFREIVARRAAAAEQEAPKPVQTAREQKIEAVRKLLTRTFRDEDKGTIEVSDGPMGRQITITEKNPKLFEVGEAGIGWRRTWWRSR